MVAEEGEGVVDGGGSCWALGVVGQSLKIVGHMGGWGGKAVVLVVEHHGSLGFVLAVASRRDGGEAMHVGWRGSRQVVSSIFHGGLLKSSS